MNERIAQPESPAQGRDPWDRYGWVLGTVWLVFLVFPLASIASGEMAAWAKITAVSCIVIFAVTYVHGLVRMDAYDGGNGVFGRGARYVAVLIALTVTTAGLAGETALGMTPFIVAFGMFALPLRSAIALTLVTVGTVLVLPLTFESFSHSWFFAPIVLTVGIATGAVRILEVRQATYRTLADEVTMAAERDRVARDVHDVLGHSLTVITVKAELAERLVDRDPGRARSELADIQSLTRQSLAEIRATVAGLRVARLAEELDAAVQALSGAGIVAELPQDPSVVDPRHRIVLAWALREAVTNVVRHSGAGRCVITLGEDWLSVVDDGSGMNGRREGNGLRGLRERVHDAGGTVEVLTLGPEGGTKVKVDL